MSQEVQRKAVLDSVWPPTAGRFEMRLLQINTHDAMGGAGRIANNLHRAYLALGHESWLAVGHRQDDREGILTIPNFEARNIVSRAIVSIARKVGKRFNDQDRQDEVVRVISGLGQPLRVARRLIGHEDFEHPGIWRIFSMLPNAPDIIHCHNLHGGFFDLRALPWLSQLAPTILTAHDAWLLSGHCAHSFDCERWLHGCGNCPDLDIYPSIARDATAYNWELKRKIYSRSRLYLSAPSQWLLEKFQRSMLGEELLDTRVIPNGVDLATFCPGDKRMAREVLGLSEEATVILFVADRFTKSPFKDWPTLRTAVHEVASRSDSAEIVFVGLGDTSRGDAAEESPVTLLPYTDDQKQLVNYYRAADLYLHAARADTFPNTILEALACGVPVVATAVGGIPEQLRPQNSINPIGFLVQPGDPQALAREALKLIGSDELRRKMSHNAAAEAKERFSLDKQVRSYIDWYADVAQSWMSGVKQGRPQ